MKTLQWLGRRLGLRTVERGASSVEYALIASLIAVVIIGGVALLGSNTADLYQTACSSLPHDGGC